MHGPQRLERRIYGLSDLHVDFRDNRLWLEEFAAQCEPGDVLVVAGDISDDLERLRRAFALLRRVFDQVFFVPGNHELWVRRKECVDSLAKYRLVVEVCRSMGVHTTPVQVGDGAAGVWIVPLLSWYVKPGQGRGSLYVPKAGEDPSLEMWADNMFVKWPSRPELGTMAEFFLRENEKHLERPFSGPVLTFSHFLPRKELMYPSEAERKARRTPWIDPHPAFNFSMVAGCSGLDEQVRRLGSTLHVYGHQHRNRTWSIEGVLYTSHCLGSPKEQGNRLTAGATRGPRLLWDESGPLPGVDL